MSDNKQFEDDEAVVSEEISPAFSCVVVSIELPIFGSVAMLVMGAEIAASSLLSSSWQSWWWCC